MATESESESIKYSLMYI